MSKLRLVAAGVTFCAAILTTGLTVAAPQEQVDVTAVVPPARKQITSVTPLYPPEAKRLGIEANVDLKVVVNGDGDVTGTESSGFGAMVHHDDQNVAERAEFVATQGSAFRDMAVAAARQWKFAPGSAQWTCVFSFRFRLKPLGSGQEKNGAEPSIGSPTPSATSSSTRPGGEPRSTPRTGALRVGRDVNSPQKMVDVKPLYPDEARAAKAKGIVLLEVTIAGDGSVSKALVLRSIPMLDQAAIDAVMQWKFQPTWLNGAPVEVEMLIFVNFVPSNKMTDLQQCLFATTL